MKLSITRALAELKMLDKRIGDAIQRASFIAVQRGEGDRATVLNNPHYTVTAASERIENDAKSIDALIDRYSKIKTQIILSNAVTVVRVGEKAMTVAEAIERKSSVKYAAQLATTMGAQLGQMKSSIEKGNADLDAEIDKQVQIAYTNDKGRVTVDQYNLIANPRRAERKLSAIDPLKLEDTLASLRADIDDFVLNVDFALSEINAKTEIEVD